MQSINCIQLYTDMKQAVPRVQSLNLTAWSHDILLS